MPSSPTRQQQHPARATKIAAITTAAAASPIAAKIGMNENDVRPIENVSTGCG